jgi:hypothetical protein
VAAAACVVLAGCSGGPKPSEALVNNSSVLAYCAQQLTGDAVTIAAGWVENTTGAPVTAEPDAVLVNPTPGIKMAGYYLADPSAASTTVNGGDFTMPADPPLTVPAHGSALVVIGIGLAGGVPTAHADGIEFHYRSTAGRGTLRTPTVLQTTDGRACPQSTVDSSSP